MHDDVDTVFKRTKARGGSKCVINAEQHTVFASGVMEEAHAPGRSHFRITYPADLDATGPFLHVRPTEEVAALIDHFPSVDGRSVPITVFVPIERESSDFAPFGSAWDRQALRETLDRIRTDLARRSHVNDATISATIVDHAEVTGCVSLEIAEGS